MFEIMMIIRIMLALFCIACSIPLMFRSRTHGMILLCWVVAFGLLVADFG